MRRHTRDEVLGRNCRFLQGPETEPEMVTSMQACVAKGIDCFVKLRGYACILCRDDFEGAVPEALKRQLCDNTSLALYRRVYMYDAYLMLIGSRLRREVLAARLGELLRHETPLFLSEEGTPSDEMASESGDEIASITERVRRIVRDEELPLLLPDDTESSDE